MTSLGGPGPTAGAALSWEADLPSIGAPDQPVTDLSTDEARLADAAGFLAQYTRIRALDLNRAYRYKVYARILAARNRHPEYSEGYMALNALLLELGGDPNPTGGP